ncbi:hypothetical protein ACFYQ5_25695 [Streptomyces sp. NPDC005794]|uniref:hypothetical protein n=1 Tax=Streptomyces sp. NPDC005794 TaxID=3364733 RepID=UPI0036BAE91B
MLTSIDAECQASYIDSNRNSNPYRSPVPNDVTAMTGYEQVRSVATGQADEGGCCGS